MLLAVSSMAGSVTGSLALAASGIWSVAKSWTKLVPRIQPGVEAREQPFVFDEVARYSQLLGDTFRGAFSAKTHHGPKGSICGPTELSHRRIGRQQLDLDFSQPGYVNEESLDAVTSSATVASRLIDLLKLLHGHGHTLLDDSPGLSPVFVVDESACCLLFSACEANSEYSDNLHRNFDSAQYQGQAGVVVGQAAGFFRAAKAQRDNQYSRAAAGEDTSDDAIRIRTSKLEALRFGVVPRLLSFTPEILSMADDLQSRARWERDDIEEMMGEFTDEFGYFFRNKAIVGAQLSTFNTHGIMEQATESTTAQQLSQGIIGVGSSGTSLSENMTESKSVARFSFGGGHLTHADFESKTCRIQQLRVLSTSPPVPLLKWIVQVNARTMRRFAKDGGAKHDVTSIFKLFLLYGHHFRQPIFVYLACRGMQDSWIILDEESRDLTSRMRGIYGIDRTLEEENRHRGVSCDRCPEKDIAVRYKCRKCPNFDLCGDCFSEDPCHRLTVMDDTHCHGAACHLEPCDFELITLPLPQGEQSTSDFEPSTVV